MASAQPQDAKQIVLIGGNTAHGPGTHDSRNAIAQIARYFETSPQIRPMMTVSVKAYPKGWPSDPEALNRASTIVWYFDGMENHPLLHAKPREQFERLARRGVGW